MGRARTGTFRKSGQAWLVMVTLPASLFPAGKLPPPIVDAKTKEQKAHPRRLGVPVPAFIDGRETSKKELENFAKLYAERPDLAIVRCAKLGKLPSWIPAEMVPSDALQAAASANPIGANTPGTPIETVATYADRWLKWRDDRGMAGIDMYHSALDKQILSIEVEPGIKFGERPIAKVSRADCKAVAKCLCVKAAQEVLMASSAVRYWIIVTSMMVASCNDNEPSLCVRDDNPALGIKGPMVAKKRTRGCLYPSEFLQLITCEQIPLENRRIIVLAIYLQMRAGELKRIRCEDIDLAHEIITVRRSWDSYRKREKGPKNGKPRQFEIHPHVLPLLRAMIAERGGTGVLLKVNPYRVSHIFVTHLDAAGLHRWELRNRTANHIPLTFHGLRATGATWAARTETNLLKLRHMLGHSDQKTTDGYIETAQLMGRNVGEVFPPVPAPLLIPYRSGNRSVGVNTPQKQGLSFHQGRNDFSTAA